MCLPLAAALAEEKSAVERGEYVFRASGGCSCHTDWANKGAFMAGGRPIKTPFGTVYGTNITPAMKTGIGGWSDADFIRAMRQGIAPDGTHYFPVFPYTSFTRMSDRDLMDLKAYLFSLPAVEQENIPPDLAAPFGWRPLLGVWKWLYLQPGALGPEPGREAQWNRGAYLAMAPGHCAECHTPRDLMGGLNAEMAYAGSAQGPEGERAPNITPDRETGIGEWSTADLVWYLQTGFKPDGDDAQGLMAELIENGYRYLSKSDLQALAAYLRSLEPVANRVVAGE
jgi:mono/diheme cytochrome c family protein